MDKIDCGGKFMPKRKGYARLRDIPSDRIVLFNRGEMETATLTEQTAMDFAVLLGTLDGWSGNAAGLAQEAESQGFSGQGLVKRMEMAGPSPDMACQYLLRAAAMKAVMSRILLRTG